SFSSSILPMSSAHLSADPHSAYVSTQKVPVTTVEDLVAEHQVDPATSLLKVDTQGYEAEVLAGAGKLLEQFGALQLELSFVELYDGQKLYDELTAQVQDLGFTLWSIDPGISANDGRMLQCDGLFLRQPAESGRS
ncbi:MAG: FkbM family methyltransferase, partial [Marmoricola sp.]